ncbi:hypothetical protein [Caulobacter sp. CCG-8]|uniref:hypothetical protein n=1 Tax=Caulobacter sp. CCG-8 TaxID=3127958 RepID=UPI00307EAB4F
MRGAILSPAVLSIAVLSIAVLAAAATTLAQAETPTIRSFRAVSSSRVAIPATPRPPMTPSVMPRTTPAATPPHCPPPKPPPKPPLSVSIPKPDYNKRTMALIQQNIVMMAAMRAAETPRPCDPSWSAKKLARKGCPPVQLSPEMIVANAHEAAFDPVPGQN